MKVYKVGFVGAGLQARRRIPAINSFKNSKVVGITSQTQITAKNLADKFSIPILYKDWRHLVNDKNIDIVVVSTYPDTHEAITIEALKNCKHVLCEKPLAKTILEAERMTQAAKKYGKVLACGFNHRFHPAIAESKKIIEAGKIGKLLFGRGIYGYCGRPGSENEWRTNKKYVSGGILMEQGIHLIDLFRWLFGDFNQASCFSDTLYFPISPFEDNTFVLLKTKTNQTVSIHSTILQWKNTFVLEAYGTEGYIKVNGLGSSYGNEKLILGKKDYTGPFREDVFEFRGEDISWKKEWEEFLNTIEKNNGAFHDGEDGVEAMRIVDACYDSSKKKRVVFL